MEGGDSYDRERIKQIVERSQRRDNKRIEQVYRIKSILEKLDVMGVSLSKEERSESDRQTLNVNIPFYRIMIGKGGNEQDNPLDQIIQEFSNSERMVELMDGQLDEVERRVDECYEQYKKSEDF